MLFADNSEVTLTPPERAFLDASLAQRELERELERAQREREALLSAGAVVLAAVTALALFAVVRRRGADPGEEARRLAAASADASRDDPELATLLALESLAISGREDSAGADIVLGFLPTAGLRVFPSPDIEPTDLAPETFGDVTADAPADLVAWLAERPFLHADPINEGLRVGSLEGRGFAYEVGELSRESRGAATFWGAGRAFHVAAGERGWILEVDVAGQTVLTMIRDEPATAELLPTVALEVAPVPARAGDATRLPYFTPALDPAAQYYIDRIVRGLGLVVTTDAEPVTASQRDGVVWFGDPRQSPATRHYYFTALDASQAVANADPSLNPYILVRPGGIVRWELSRFLSRTTPLPADPVRWLTEQPYVVVVEPARDVQIAGHPARVADVRADRLVDALTCPDGVGSCVMPFAHAPDAFPIVISSEYVTRVVDLTVGSSRVLIATDLGTPGETLLASLDAFVAGSP